MSASFDDASEKGIKSLAGDGVRPAHLHTIAEQQEARTLFTFKEGKRILLKCDLALVPLLMVAYMLRSMDSSAISFVRTMKPGTDTNILRQLNIAANDYSYTSTVFTVFVVLGEIPSNMLFKWATPRLHYVRIVLLWSIAAACQAASQNLGGLLATRALLGLFEAGMYPGILVHLSSWYRPDEIGLRLAVIGALYQFANILNAFMTYGFSFVSGNRGISGWQWVFMTQGLMGIVMSIAIWIWMPNYPDTAKFLTQEERQWVIGRLPANAARGSDKVFDLGEFKRALLDKVNLCFAICLMLYQSGLLGYQFWLPTVIANLGFSGTASTQLLNIPPAFLYWVGGIFGSWFNDHAFFLPRPFCFCIAVAAWSGCLAALAFVRNTGALYGIICIASFFSAWGFNSFFPWRSQSLRGSTDAAFAFAFINGAGQIPGLYTAQIYRSKVSRLRQDPLSRRADFFLHSLFLLWHYVIIFTYAPRYTIPFMVSLGLTIASGLFSFVCWFCTYDTERATRRIAHERRVQGRKNNIVLEEDVVVDEAVTARNDAKAQ